MSLIFIIALMYVQINLVNKRECSVFYLQLVNYIKIIALVHDTKGCQDNRKVFSLSTPCLASMHAMSLANMSKNHLNQCLYMPLANTLKNHRIDKDKNLISLK